MNRTGVGMARAAHLGIAGASALAALGAREGSWTRLGLSALAGIELLNAAGEPPRSSGGEPVGLARAVGAPHLADVNGVVMRWHESGDADPDAVRVVLIHGIPTGPALWRRVIPRVAGPEVRCLAWEMVGYAGSMDAGRGRDISIAAQADYLAAWLDRLGIARAVLVGHDLGGGVVQRLAALEPGRVLGLVLADCIAFDNWPVTPVLASRAMAGLIERMPPALLRPLFQSALIYLGHDDPQIRDESSAIHWAPYDRPDGQAAFARQLRSLDARDTMEIAEGLTQLRGVPSRVVWGGLDPLGTESAHRLARAIDAPLRMLPQARHFTPEDHPAAIASAVREVLTEVSRLAYAPGSAAHAATGFGQGA